MITAKPLGNICTRELNRITLPLKLMTLLPTGNGPGLIQLTCAWEWLRAVLAGSAQNSASTCSVNLARWTVEFQHLCGDLTLFNLPILWFCVQYTGLIVRLQQFSTFCHRIYCALLTLADISSPNWDQMLTSLSWTDYTDLIKLFKTFPYKHVFETSYL